MNGNIPPVPNNNRQTPPVPQNLQNQQPRQFSPGQPLPPGAVIQQKKKSKAWIWIIVAVVGVLILYPFMPKSEKTDKAQPAEPETEAAAPEEEPEEEPAPEPEPEKAAPAAAADPEPEPAPEPEPEPEPEPLTESEYIEQVRAIVPNGMGAGEKITDVTLNNRVLTVSVDLSGSTADAPAGFTDVMLADARASQITEQVLKLPWDFWDTVVVDFVGVGTSTNGKDKIVTTEYGSYFSGITLEVPPPDFSSVQKIHTLHAGQYTCGIDIPSGRFNITAVSGNGNVMTSLNVYTEGGLNELMGVADDDIYSKTYNGAKMPEGAILYIKSSLVVEIEYTRIDGGYTRRVADEENALVLGPGQYIAGEDFPEGTYSIEAVSGKGNVMSSGVKEGINEIMGVSEENMYIQRFDHMYLETGRELKILSLTVRLIPETAP